MARMVAIYRAPKVLRASFDEHDLTVHLPMAKKQLGLLKDEVSRRRSLTPGSDSEWYLVGTRYFDDVATARCAFASPEWKACAADPSVV